MNPLNVSCEWRLPLHCPVERQPASFAWWLCSETFEGRRKKVTLVRQSNARTRRYLIRVYHFGRSVVTLNNNCMTPTSPFPYINTSCFLRQHFSKLYLFRLSCSHSYLRTLFPLYTFAPTSISYLNFLF